MAVSREDSQQTNTGLEPVDLGQSKYNFKYLVFPNDLGMEDNAHYMMININVPTKTFSPDTPAGVYAGRQFTPLSGERSKVDKLRYGQGGSLRTIPFENGSNGGATSIVSLPRRTMRIAESVVLHMPNPLVYNTQNAYEEISLTAFAGKVGSSFIGGIGNIIAGATRPLQAALERGARPTSNPLAPNSLLSTASKLLQSPINPAVEILFSNTLVRQFTFEVLMAPRNELESEVMHNIIKTLRFHAAPEVSNIGLGDVASGLGFNGAAAALNRMGNPGAGLFWIPPAEFDITFFHMGIENTNILRVNTCVLERIEVDYAPTGTYSTFRNGHPVAARLSMGFRELEPVHKRRVLQGF